jgi:antitoxin component of MazEF toxin-antitoxin module
MSEANLREGDAVEFEVKSPGIIVVRTSHSQPTLQDLIAGITPGIAIRRPRGEA